MNIRKAGEGEKGVWNQFVGDNFAPVGAFMQTWEWGEFQKESGRNIGRYLVLEDKAILAIFTIVEHAMPFGFLYGYAPRGPVLAKDLREEKIVELFQSLREWSKKEFPQYVFVRLEPPKASLPTALHKPHFSIPSYYVQPRFNLAVDLGPSEEEIVAAFHPSTRSNIKRAEKRGVTVKINGMGEGQYEEFVSMMRDTAKRHNGDDAYPGEKYFKSLIKAVPSVEKVMSRNDLSIGMFYGYQNGEPAATHLILFFGNTATYLYGASYSKHLSSKVSTYLHFAAMKEAKRLGYHYYDLGGIDVSRWKSLTEFKRQFRGEEFTYMGNIDIPLRPVLYRVYNALRSRKK